MLEALGIVRDVTTFSRVQVVDHTAVEGEERGCRTNFSTHVTDRSHTRAGQRFDTRTVIFDNRTSTALDRKNTSNLQNDI